MRVETQSGRFWNGRVLSETPQEVVIQTQGGPLTIPRSTIRRMVPVSSVPPQPAPQAAGGRGQPVPSRPPGAANAPAVTQAGAAVPAQRLRPQERAGTMRLSGEGALGTQLLPALLGEYGQDAGLGALREDMAPDPSERMFVIGGPETARDIRVDVHVHGASHAFADLAAGRADLGMAARRATDAEWRQLQIPGPTRQGGLEQVVALGGVAIIVHRENPVAQLTMEQARDMLAGALTRWTDIGGPPVPVTVYALLDTADATEAVRDRLMGGAQARLSPRARRFESHEDLADALAADPGGIGFVNLAHVRNAKALRLRGACGLIFETSPFQLRSEEYPLSQRMYLYGSARATALARDFLAFSVTDRVQPAIARAGFVNQAPLLSSAAETEAQVKAAGEALPADLRAVAAPEVAQFRQLVAGARRLSVTFRFEAGRTDLDPRAEADIGRLARWTREADNARKSILLIGHASVDGTYNSNLALSRARAQSVATRLAALGVPVAQVESVGPASPIACAGGSGETDINRRVEVWIK